jgi:hypothetical protein
VGGVVVAAVEEAEGVGGGEAAEELDEADFIVDFEIWSRHGCVCSINVRCRGRFLDDGRDMETRGHVRGSLQRLIRCGKLRVCHCVISIGTEYQRRLCSLAVELVYDGDTIGHSCS